MTKKIKDATKLDYPDAINVLFELSHGVDGMEDYSNDLMDALDMTYAQVLMLAAAEKLDRCDLIEAHVDAVAALVSVHNAANLASRKIGKLLDRISECADNAPKFREVM